ncbi:MAG: glycosyltransferase [Lachnospiraceae bacterium]|nr:glycosyltransferase [Lachnospiraceae bacterium]
MKHNFKYSIIIPHYNRPQLLAKLLATIPKDPSIQVIVVDDNSTKDTTILTQVIQEDNRCEYYRNSSGHQSAGACRNEGLRHTTGEWVLFADADDVFLPHFFETIQRFYTAKEDVILFMPTSIEEDTQMRSDRHILWEKAIEDYLTHKTPENTAYLRYNFNPPWSKMIKRDLIETHQLTFAETLVYNDLLFAAKLGCALRTFQVTKEQIYCVVKNKGSLSTLRSQAVFDIRTQAFLECYCYLKEHLPKNEFRSIQTRGAQHLMEAHMNHLPIRQIWKIYRLFRKNKVKMIRSDYLNPIWLLKAITQRRTLRKTSEKCDTPFVPKS